MTKTYHRILTTVTNIIILMIGFFISTQREDVEVPTIQEQSVSISVKQGVPRDALYGTYRVGTSQVKVHSKPDLLYSSYDYLERDDEFEVIHISDDRQWVTVGYSGITKYMFWEGFQYCSYIGEYSELTPKIKLKVNCVNLRQEPNTESTILKQLRYQDDCYLRSHEIYVDDQGVSWIKAYYPPRDAKGYIMLDYVEVEGLSNGVEE